MILMFAINVGDLSLGGPTFSGPGSCRIAQLSPRFVPMVRADGAA
jgi:hypothetical protein